MSTQGKIGIKVIPNVRSYPGSDAGLKGLAKIMEKSRIKCPGCDVDTVHVGLPFVTIESKEVQDILQNQDVINIPMWTEECFCAWLLRVWFDQGGSFVDIKILNTCDAYDVSDGGEYRRHHEYETIFKLAVDNLFPKETSKVTPSLRFQVLKRDAYRCRLCGVSARDGEHVRLEIDHITPRSKGGTDDISNLWVLCFACNRGKGASHL